MKMYFIECNEPWKPPRHMEVARHRHGSKYVYNGERNYYVAVSAFECLMVAEHHRHVRLQRIAGNAYLRNHNPLKWQAAVRALGAIRSS